MTDEIRIKLNSLEGKCTAPAPDSGRTCGQEEDQLELLGTCCQPQSGADQGVLLDTSFETKVEKPRLLLHSCCGPCSTACIERLISTYKVTIFYYNPNIHGEDEYEKRKATQIEFLNKLNDSHIYEDTVEFVEGEYDTESFFKVTCGLEEEREGGARCAECFRLRLERTAVKARVLGFDTFGTTLTVSPYKNYRVITEIGSDIAFKYGLKWLDMDFKKKDGYHRSIELSKMYGLYRQHYCGCIYSLRDAEAYRAAKLAREQNQSGLEDIFKTSKED